MVYAPVEPLAEHAPNTMPLAGIAFVHDAGALLLNIASQLNTHRRHVLFDAFNGIISHPGHDYLEQARLTQLFSLLAARISHIAVVEQSPVHAATFPPLLNLVFHSWNAVSFDAKTSVRVCQNDALRGSEAPRGMPVKADTRGP